MDCFSTSTGHGLPRIAKSDNLFLGILWTVFFIVAFSGNSYMIYQSLEEFLQYGVITTTKIKTETEITFPALTFCSESNRKDQYNTQDMIMKCKFGPLGEDCKMTNLSVYNNWAERYNCFQLNNGVNPVELIKSKHAGWDYYFNIVLYLPEGAWFRFAVNDNNDKVVSQDVNKEAFPGQYSEIDLIKTNQISLGPPYSNCNETKNYRQINCIRDCFNRNMSEICGCAFPESCGRYNDWNRKCLDAYEMNELLIIAQCSNQCTAECNQVSFAIRRIDVEWINYFEDIYNDEYTSKVSEKFNISDVLDYSEYKKRFSCLWFYFSELKTTEITQSPSMTLTSLIANVGGLLGKYLSIKFFSQIFNLMKIYFMKVYFWASVCCRQ